MRGQTLGWSWLALCGGALLSAALFVCALFWNDIFDSFIAAQLQLVPGSRAFENWRTPSVVMYQDVYMFNWTNAEKFPDEKPVLEELGPYRYREFRKLVNVSLTPENGTVGYRTLKYWKYEPEPGSKRSLEDNVTMVNVIAASAAYRSRYWGFLRQKGLSMGLTMFGQKISVSKLVKELLFDGYDDPLLDLAKSLPASATGGAPQVDKFGLFYGRNDSIEEDGYHEVTDGRSGLPGQILKWNGKDHLPFFEGQCSKLEGGIGFFPRNLGEDSYLKMFISQLCRSVTLKFDGSGEVDEVPYNKFAFYEGTFDKSSSRPENSCYCGSSRACTWAGVMNVSACNFGSPAFLSLPHFLHADPALASMMHGIKPNREKHAFYFNIEPKFGVPVEVAGRFQFNVLLEPSENIMLYHNVPSMLFPVFWVEQRFAMSAPQLAEIRSARRMAAAGGVLIAATALLAALGVAISAACMRRRFVQAEKKLARTDEAEIKLNPEKTYQ